MYIPFNAATLKPYKGKNVDTLTQAAQELNGLNDPRWLTFVQAKNLGFKIKKGSHATKIFFAKPIDDDFTLVTDNDNEANLQKGTFKHYSVFHASQIDGIGEYKP